jgi:flagellar hook-associated protein 3 FlgL
MTRNAQSNLQTSAQRLATLQDQGSSLQLITKPSDDPRGTSASLAVRSQISASDQYSRNIDNGIGWIKTIDSALTTTEGLLQRVRDLTVKGANTATLSPAALEAIAVEVDSLRDALMIEANTSFNGRSVFAGTSDAGVAFQPDYSYTGVAGSTVERRIADASTIAVDADGTAVYGVGAGSVFALLDQISTDLRSGTNVGPRLDEIDDRLTAIVVVHASVGARQTQLETADRNLASAAIALEERRATIEDVDISRLVLDLKQQEVNYQAALSVSARAIPQTLMDFLR